MLGTLLYTYGMCISACCSHSYSESLAAILHALISGTMRKNTIFCTQTAVYSLSSLENIQFVGLCLLHCMQQICNFCKFCKFACRHS